MIDKNIDSRRYSIQKLSSSGNSLGISYLSANSFSDVIDNVISNEGSLCYTASIEITRAGIDYCSKHRR